MYILLCVYFHPFSQSLLTLHCLHCDIYSYPTNVGGGSYIIDRLLRVAAYSNYLTVFLFPRFMSNNCEGFGYGLSVILEGSCVEWPVSSMVMLGSGMTFKMWVLVGSWREGRKP